MLFGPLPTRRMRRGARFRPHRQDPAPGAPWRPFVRYRHGTRHGVTSRRLGYLECLMCLIRASDAGFTELSHGRPRRPQGGGPGRPAAGRFPALKLRRPDRRFRHRHSRAACGRSGKFGRHECLTCLTSRIRCRFHGLFHTAPPVSHGGERGVRRWSHLSHHTHPMPVPWAFPLRTPCLTRPPEKPPPQMKIGPGPHFTGVHFRKPALPQSRSPGGWHRGEE
jgi:hypothetical protein